MQAECKICHHLNSFFSPLTFWTVALQAGKNPTTNLLDTVDENQHFKNKIQSSYSIQRHLENEF